MEARLARYRRIPRNPVGRNCFLVDACFLANRFLDPANVKDPVQRARVERSLEWWSEIDRQLEAEQAIIYVPDICIAEAFKVLARKYYRAKEFPSSQAYSAARKALSEFVRTPILNLKSRSRSVRVHDISTTRDIIIAVDRFFEVFFKKKLEVSVPDLIILATAKYLLDFFGIPWDTLFIITIDRALWEGSKHIQDIPGAYNPDKTPAAKIFV